MESGDHAPRTGSSKCHRPLAAFFRYTARVPISFFFIGRDVTCLDARL